MIFVLAVVKVAKRDVTAVRSLDTSVAGLDNDVAVILDRHTIGVDGYYVPATR